MSNKDFKRKALSDDQLKNVTGGMTDKSITIENIDDDLIITSSIGKYKIPKNQASSLLSFLYNIEFFIDEMDQIPPRAQDQLYEYNKYKIQE